MPHINTLRRLMEKAWFWILKESRHDPTQITLGTAFILEQMTLSVYLSEVTGHLMLFHKQDYVPDTICKTYFIQIPEMNGVHSGELMQHSAL